MANKIFIDGHGEQQTDTPMMRSYDGRICVLLHAVFRLDSSGTDPHSKARTLTVFREVTGTVRGSTVTTALTACALAC